MTDALLSSADYEEALSRVYVAAIAAAAGYTTAQANFDRDGVDLQINAGGRMFPSLGLQLKATINLPEAAPGLFRYPLKRRNHDLLRCETIVPRILVVVHLARDETRGLDVGPDHLILRHCAYWTSLAHQPETDNTESVTVSLRRANRFDPNGLRALMEQARTGAIT